MHEYVLPVQLNKRMKKKTRTITLSALFSALAVIILYFASIWPTGQLGLAAAASVFVAAAVIETGLISGVNVYIVSSVLSMLIVPNRVVALLYVCFFGFYPILKSLIERFGRTIVQWALKLLVFNISLAAIWIFLRELFFDYELFDNIPGVTILVFVCGSIVFALFDYGFSKIIWLYIRRVSNLM